MTRYRCSGIIAAVAAAVVIGMASAQPAEAPEPHGPPATDDTSYQTFTLDNGLRVVLRPFAQTEMVSVLVLYDIGDANDPEGKSGLARLMTRLYVTSPAGKRPARTIADLAQIYAEPMSFNAQAGERYTIAATQAPADRLERELAEAADRMALLAPTQADIDRKRPELVRAVRSMHTELPPQATFVRTREMLHPSPPGASIGGVASDILSITENDVREHLRFYKPRNATLVLSGAFDPVAVRPMIERIFSPIPAGEPVPAPRPSQRPMLGGLAELTIQTDQPQWRGRSLISIGFIPPEPGSEHYAAFQVLIGYLYQLINTNTMRTREGSDVLQSQILYRTVEDPAIVQVAGSVSDTAQPARALDDLRDLIDRIIATLDDGQPIDLTLARMTFASFGLFRVEDAELWDKVHTVAVGMGRLLQMGVDPPRLIAAIENVTKDDLIECAQAVFDDSNSAAVFTRIEVLAPPEGIAAPPEG